MVRYPERFVVVEMNFHFENKDENYSITREDYASVQKKIEAFIKRNSAWQPVAHFFLERYAIRVILSLDTVFGSSQDEFESLRNKFNRLIDSWPMGATYQYSHTTLMLQEQTIVKAS